MKNLAKIFDTKYGGLIFSLLSGTAYYIIILDFIIQSTKNKGTLLGFFFFPAIICGMGLFIFKTVQKLKTEENYSKINIFLAAHILLMIISIVFLFDIIK